MSGARKGAAHGAGVGMVVWDGDSRPRAVGGAECHEGCSLDVRGGLRLFRHEIVPLTGARD